LPTHLWPEIWKFVVHVYNLSPHRATNAIPLSVIDAPRIPDVSHLRIIGSYAFSHVLPAQRDHKFPPTAEKLVFIGYSETSKGYRLWNPVTDEIVERFDVTVNESRPFDPALHAHTGTALVDPDTPLDAHDAHSDAQNEYVVKRIVGRLKGYPSSANSWEPFDNLNCTDRICQYFHRKRPPIPPHFAMRALRVLLQLTLFSPFTRILPTRTTGLRVYTSNHAPTVRRLHAPKELAALRANRVIELVTLARDVHPYTQRKHVDYEEAYSPVISFPALRFLLAVTTYYDWSLRSLDFITAYLNSPLDRPIYIRQIEGYKEFPDDDTKGVLFTDIEVADVNVLAPFVDATSVPADLQYAVVVNKEGNGTCVTKEILDDVTKPGDFPTRF
ncbi:MAG: hypothetical protein BJ554DRAFT_4948, partial [Olpidium bornovanus]